MASVIICVVLPLLLPLLARGALYPVPPAPLGFITPMVLDEDNELLQLLHNMPTTSSSSSTDGHDHYQAGSDGHSELPEFLLSRTTRGSFPYSTIAYYRALRPQLVNKYLQLQHAAEDAPLNAKELAELVDMLEGRAKKAEAEGAAMRDRRSHKGGGAAIKRYACRFKFCRIFSPTDE